jgi:hypothetical protein
MALLGLTVKDECPAAALVGLLDFVLRFCSFQGRRRNWTRLQDRGGSPGRRGEPPGSGECGRLHPVRNSRSSWTRDRQLIGFWMRSQHDGQYDAGVSLIARF